MGHDAGYRDTLPTRSKRGYQRQLLEARLSNDRREEHINTGPTEVEQVNPRKADPERFSLGL